MLLIDPIPIQFAFLCLGVGKQISPFVLMLNEECHFIFEKPGVRAQV